MSSWALTRSLSCATTGLRMSSWGMWGYNASSHEIVTSHCADISTSTTHNSSQPGMTPIMTRCTKLGQYLACANTRFLNNTFQAVEGGRVPVGLQGATCVCANLQQLFNHLLRVEKVVKVQVTMGMVKRLADIHDHSCA